MIIQFILKVLEVFYYTAKNLPRDVRGLVTFAKIKAKLRKLDKYQYNVTDVFSKWVKSQPNKACIIFNDVTWTFKDLDDYANKIANLFQKNGLKKGDTVALLMENKPEYVGIWLGLSRLGVITACINTNLRSKALTHSINVAKASYLIYDHVLADAVTDIKSDLSSELNYIIQGDSMKTENLESLIKNQPTSFSESEDVRSNDVLMYIYTSGTTGLPKPAIIKHSRYIAAGFTFFDTCGLNTEDIFLVALPIYHSNAGMIGIGAALTSGATVVLRRKFSATNFWKECIQYKVTSFCYVGEVCRYLVNQPASEFDKAHSVRACIGNGTRANIHKEFTNRFGVKLMELYGASEGNCILINNVAKMGACGYLPRVNLYLKFLPTFILKIDQEGNPIRDQNGFCVHCDPNEKGLIVGLINQNITRQQYSGYANQPEASNKKIIKNLFKEGQNGFNTGDLATSDKDGYIYFVDRLGDTFRWRGENVATIEVENIISARLDSTEVIVYGVEIAGQEGKAGMATLMTLECDVKKLCEGLKKDLPSYAKPLFLRLNDKVDHTGSMKAQKTKLMKEGFNVNLFPDKTYYYNSKAGTYCELTKEIYEDIQNGSIRM